MGKSTPDWHTFYQFLGILVYKSVWLTSVYLLFVVMGRSCHSLDEDWEERWDKEEEQQPRWRRQWADG